jgi:hypothetical protein
MIDPQLLPVSFLIVSLAVLILLREGAFRKTLPESLIGKFLVGIGAAVAFLTSTFFVAIVMFFARGHYC